MPDRAFDGAALLISVPQGGSIAAITDALVKAGASVRASALVGSHATRYRVSADGARPVAPAADGALDPVAAVRKHALVVRRLPSCHGLMFRPSR